VRLDRRCESETGVHPAWLRLEAFKEDDMKAILLAATLSLVAGQAFAGSCKVDAADKKLAGAAMTSFMKKCEKDSQAACDKSAADMKLSGAAKTSHVKKCMSDAVGT
jgi:hypothetical protein